jgi:hypothetical protein
MLGLTVRRVGDDSRYRGGVTLEVRAGCWVMRIGQVLRSQ